MRNKDTILLENAYLSILEASPFDREYTEEENAHDQVMTCFYFKNSSVIEEVTKFIIDNGGRVKNPEPIEGLTKFDQNHTELEKIQQQLNFCFSFENSNVIPEIAKFILSKGGQVEDLEAQGGEYLTNLNDPRMAAFRK